MHSGTLGRQHGPEEGADAEARETAAFIDEQQEWHGWLMQEVCHCLAFPNVLKLRLVCKQWRDWADEILLLRTSATFDTNLPVSSTNTRLSKYAAAGKRLLAATITSSKRKKATPCFPDMVQTEDTKVDTGGELVATDAHIAAVLQHGIATLHITQNIYPMTSFGWFKIADQLQVLNLDDTGTGMAQAVKALVSAVPFLEQAAMLHTASFPTYISWNYEDPAQHTLACQYAQRLAALTQLRRLTASLPAHFIIYPHLPSILELPHLEDLGLTLQSMIWPASIPLAVAGALKLLSSCNLSPTLQTAEIHSHGASFKYEHQEWTVSASCTFQDPDNILTIHAADLQVHQYDATHEQTTVVGGANANLAADSAQNNNVVEHASTTADMTDIFTSIVNQHPAGQDLRLVVEVNAEIVLLNPDGGMDAAPADSLDALVLPHRALSLSLHNTSSLKILTLRMLDSAGYSLQLQNCSNLQQLKLSDGSLSSYSRMASLDVVPLLRILHNEAPLLSSLIIHRVMNWCPEDYYGLARLIRLQRLELTWNHPNTSDDIRVRPVFHVSCLPSGLTTLLLENSNIEMTVRIPHLPKLQSINIAGSKDSQRVQVQPLSETLGSSCCPSLESLSIVYASTPMDISDLACFSALRSLEFGDSRGVGISCNGLTSLGRMLHLCSLHLPPMTFSAAVIEAVARLDTVQHLALQLNCNDADRQDISTGIQLLGTMWWLKDVTVTLYSHQLAAEMAPVIESFRKQNTLPLLLLIPGPPMHWQEWASQVAGCLRERLPRTTVDVHLKITHNAEASDLIPLLSKDEG